MTYKIDDLIIHAALLQHLMGEKLTPRKFKAEMLQQFPQLTTYELRRAREHARMMLAIQIAGQTLVR